MRIVLVVLIALVAPSGAVAAGKVTVDPNTPASAAKAAPVDDTDKRLLQKVTFDLGYTRLHYALEEISAKTGVTVRCGANKDNWQVRDLPIVVCAKDIPLGKLLRAIADSAHLDLTAETIETDKGKPERVYRVWFSAKSQVELDNYRAEEREAGLAKQSRAWDTCVTYADTPDARPDSQKDLPPEAESLFQTSKAVAGILKDLGPEAKAKVMAGERIDLTLQTCKKPDIFRELYQLAQKNAYRFSTTIEPPTDDQMNAATFSIIPSESAATGRFGVSVSMAPMRSGATAMSWGTNLTAAAFELWFRATKSEKDWPAGPSEPVLPDHISKDLVPINFQAESIAKPAILNQKVKLDLPKDRDVTYADAMAALAKASGLTIVSEDFMSHQQRWYLAQSMGTFIDDQQGVGAQKTYLSPLGAQTGEMTVGDVLSKLSTPALGRVVLYWFVNEKDKLVVGRPPDWLQAHLDMMPESLLTYLRDKANSDGIELDDLSKLTRYTLSQYEQWVRKSNDLFFIQNVAHGSSISDVFWHFYDRLPAEDRAVARSDAGLPLANYDTVWIADFVKAQTDSVTTIYGAMTLEDQRRMKEEADRKVALLTDPEVISGMVLTIKTKPATFWTTFQADSIAAFTSSIPKGIERHTYYPVLEGESKGQKISVQLDPLCNAFPIYSPKREAELAEKRKKQP